MGCEFRKWYVVSLLFAAVFSLSGCRGWWFWTPGDSVDNVGYHPEQPIAFSHKNHAGDRQIPCEYCHSSARRSISAGVPSMNTCMGCHKFVGTDLEPIKLLTAKYKANEPVLWTKVHDLPDFVRFPHNRHVLSGVACQECHGEVEKMDATVHQVAPLQMGWCISCHEERGPRAADTNVADLKTGKPGFKMIASRDNVVKTTATDAQPASSAPKSHRVDETMTKCQTCHY